MRQRRSRRLAAVPRTPARRLAEAERLFRDFVSLTPYRYKPFTRSFRSFKAYERWRRAQRNPWYR